jgi:hypothetical protein
LVPTYYTIDSKRSTSQEKPAGGGLGAGRAPARSVFWKNASRPRRLDDRAAGLGDYRRCARPSPRKKAAAQPPSQHTRYWPNREPIVTGVFRRRTLVSKFMRVSAHGRSGNLAVRRSAQSNRIHHEGSAVTETAFSPFVIHPKPASPCIGRPRDNLLT